MKKVRDGLYIGALDDALAFLSGTKRGITHLLSLAPLYFLRNDKALGALTEFRMRESLRAAMLESVQKAADEDDAVAVAAELAAKCPSAPDKVQLTRKTISLKDTDAENLLDVLEECLSFVDKAMQEGIVLVHCVAGISRSASVVTAYLMRKDNLSLNDALASLRSCSKTACPNRGFMQQLKLFETMGCVVDKSSSAYRSFFMEQLGYAYERGEIDLSRFAEDPGQIIPATLAAAAEAQILTSTSSSRSSSSSSSKGPTTIYRCKKCRRMVATHANVIEHEPGAQAKPFNRKKAEKFDDENVIPACTSIFVEPMQWMTTTVQPGVIEGKLFCAKCNARLGGFHWAGVQCNCGNWVNPAFQLHASKVDASWT